MSSKHSRKPRPELAPLQLQQRAAAKVYKNLFGLPPERRISPAGLESLVYIITGSLQELPAPYQEIFWLRSGLKDGKAVSRNQLAQHYLYEATTITRRYQCCFDSLIGAKEQIRSLFSRHTAPPQEDTAAYDYYLQKSIYILGLPEYLERRLLAGGVKQVGHLLSAYEEKSVHNIGAQGWNSIAEALLRAQLIKKER